MPVIIKSRSRLPLPFVPEEVIFDILSRLPSSKSVIRCKVVCKAWLAMISRQQFIGARLERSKERSTILVVSVEAVHSEHIPTGIDCWPNPSHCDGLILFSTQNQEIFVCNPATKGFVTLPKGTSCFHRSQNVGFGFDPCSNKYKAARFFYELENGTSETVCRFEVLTLGTSVWRRTTNPPFAVLAIPPAQVQASLFWRINLPSPKHPKAFVCFNLGEEKFSLTPYPLCEARPIYFLELEDILCCACFTEWFEVVEIWTCNQ